MTFCMSLHDLPAELVELIAYKQTLSYSDVLNLQSCSEALYSTLHGTDKIWRSKFLLRWPYCIVAEEHRRVKNWRALYVLRESWEEKIKGVVEDIMHILIHKEETPKCIVEAAFQQLPLYGSDYTTECIIDSLFHFSSPRQKPLMSYQYYALRLLQRLHSEWLRRRWETLTAIRKAKGSIHLEDGLRFVAQFLEADQDYRSDIVGTFLTRLVRKIISRVGTTDRSLADRLNSLVGGFTSESWTPRESSFIVEELTSYVKEKYLSNTAMSGTLESCLLSETGLLSSAVACFALACAAERLGVPFTFHAGCSYVHNEIITPSLSFFGFDSAKGKKAQGFIDSELTIRYRILESDVRGSLDLMEVMSLYVSLAVGHHTSLTIIETKFYLDPHQRSLALRLMHVYLENLINIEEAKAIMMEVVRKGAGYTLLLHRFSEITKEDELKPPADLQIKQRTPELNARVCYSIGLIMTHRLYGYHCVIYGWTEKCEASQSWITMMGVDQLAYGPHQPFYNVLVSDGTSRYAAQENLKVRDSPEAITHPSIGKYFVSYEKTHYLMNSAAARLYPDDLQLTVEATRNRYKN
ncbi:F-box only protein 21-like [Watersipora subatra]|uniref:F-box only protein 21-like n=1 Tax=Watersipora subatra TaxID=2589382 RepID=UPI00355B4097